MKTLTPQILGMYLGQKAEVSTIDGIQIMEITGHTIEGEFPIEDVIPILRRLSDMTDDECLESSRLLGGAAYLSNESQISQARQLICTNDFYTKQTNVTGISWMRISTYLLSRGFDLFNLIDSGLAVENNQHPTK